MVLVVAPDALAPGAASFPPHALAATSTAKDTRRSAVERIESLGAGERKRAELSKNDCHKLRARISES
jgi:hypothetical protein